MRYPGFPIVANGGNLEKTAEIVGIFLESARRGG
jgi:hypothetical protein